MVIPLGLAEAPSQRSPWMSVLIGLVCLVVHVLDDSHLRATTPRAEQLVQFREYWNAHPYLLPPEDLALELPEEAERARAENHNRLWAGTLPNEATLAAEREVWLAPLSARVSNSWHATWGLVPTGGLPQDGLITHLFFHHDWAHLVGNLLFLWLIGFGLELLVGPFLFLALYIAGGLLSALMLYGADTHSFVPIVGASGAIAACVGASLIRQGRARSRLLLFGWGLVPSHRVEIKAWSWSALWVATQVLMALLVGVTWPAAIALAGSFGLGALVGAGLRVWLPAREGASDARPAAPRDELAWADAAAERGEYAAAVEAYRTVLRESPHSLPALWGLTRALFALDEDEEGSEIYDSVLELWMAENSEALIQQSLRLYGPQIDTRLLAPSRAAHVAPALEIIDTSRAVWAYETAARGGIAGAVIRLAELLFERGNKVAALELLEQFRTLGVRKPELLLRAQVLQRTLAPSPAARA